MADIKLIVDYGDVTKATNAVKGLGNAAVAASKGQVQSTKKADLVNKKSLATVHKQISFSKKMENQKNKEVAALNKGRQDLIKYKSAVDPVFASEQKLLNMKKLLKAEVAAGTMTWRQAGKEMLNYRKSLTALNARLGMTKNRMNASGMAIQQVGYQVGDFAVQVQGGTSAFVAFSQQATQLTGVLGMLNPRLIGLGAVLGIAIPIGSALARMFVEMGKSAEEASKDVENLMTALDKLEDASFSSSLSGVQAINDKWSNTLDLVREYYTTIADGNKTALFDVMGMTKNLDTLSGQIAVLENQKKSQGDLLDVSGTQELKDYTEEYAKLKRTKEILLTLDTSSKKNLAESFELITGSLNQEGLMTKELSTQLALFQEQANIVGIINKDRQDAHDEQVGNIKIFYDYQASEEKKALESKKRVAKIVQALKDKEYAGMQGRRGAVAPSKTDVALMGMGGVVTDLGKAEALQRKNQLEAIKHFYEEKAKTEAADLAMAKRVAEIKIELRNKEFNSMQGRSGAISPTKGQVAEMSMGPQDTEQEARLRLQEKIFTSLVNQSKTLEYTSGLSGRELIVGQQKLETFKLINQLQKSGLSYGSDGYNSAVMALEVNQERVLSAYDLIEAERLAEAEATRRNNILLDQYSKIEDELQKQADAQKRLADDIASSFGDAFMSMVDGTKSVKDSFRDMARDIIKQLYRILVVEQMVASISGFIQGAMRPAGAGPAQGPMPSGNVIPSYSGGGYTGSGSRSGGLDGKGGFMSILHPQETIIDHTKRKPSGGSTDNSSVVINQSFNFSANGDDSVKKLIAQAAPQIAKMTKSEIINDRKRGGSMKAAFG